MASQYQTMGSNPAASNPYANFMAHLEADKNPNFLWYTLTCLEKHAYAQQGDLFKAIREKMEKKYNLPSIDLWAPPL